MLGNDVVDLREPGTREKTADERFLRRVFADAEVEAIRAADDPERALWMLWAGKEAAFKVARKVRPGTVFAHKKFLCFGPGTRFQIPEGVARLPAEFGVAPLRLRWEFSDDAIHCVAAPADVPVDGLLAAVLEVDSAGDLDASELTAREALSVRNRDSLAVRLLAKRLAREAGAGEVEIVRAAEGRGFGAPLIFGRDGGRPLEGWDVSLSHHGGYVAAVVGRVSAG